MGVRPSDRGRLRLTVAQTLTLQPYRWAVAELNTATRNMRKGVRAAWTSHDFEGG